MTSTDHDGEIDRALYDFWGDYPGLAVSLQDPRKSVNDWVYEIASKVPGADPKRVAERASQALSIGQGWREKMSLDRFVDQIERVGRGEMTMTPGIPLHNGRMVDKDESE